MNQYIKDLIWDECNKANNFIEIPGIYRHFKKVKNGEDMIYAVSNISLPITDNELVTYSLADINAIMFYHTELEKHILINRIGDKYYHCAGKDKNILVIYTGLYSNRETYVRPLPMFLSRVDKVKYPNVKQKYRLEKVL